MQTLPERECYSIGDAAAHLTRKCGEYIGTHRVASVVRRLIEEGRIPERRVGRAHALLSDDLPAVEAELGIVADTEGGNGRD